MLLGGEHDKHFWVEASHLAHFGRLWTSNKPDVNNLKVFSYEAHVHIPNERSSKLCNKTRKLIFVGYDCTFSRQACHQQGCYVPRSGLRTTGGEILLPAATALFISTTGICNHQQQYSLIQWVGACFLPIFHPRRSVAYYLSVDASRHFWLLLTPSLSSWASPKQFLVQFRCSYKWLLLRSLHANLSSKCACTGGSTPMFVQRLSMLWRLAPVAIDSSTWTPADQPATNRTFRPAEEFRSASPITYVAKP